MRDTRSVTAIIAEALRGLLDSLEIEMAYVEGLSIGGGIAFRFAVSYPERVKALLMLDAITASGLPTSDVPNGSRRGRGAQTHPRRRGFIQFGPARGIPKPDFAFFARH